MPEYDHLILESEKVMLRPLSMTDIPDLQKYTGDTGLWRWFTSDLSEPGELENWIKAAIEEQKERKRIPLTIVDKITGEITGSTSYGNISELHGRIEIGWTWLGRKFHGSGLNSAVKVLMFEYAFEKCGYVRVELKTDVLNIPARKAMKKLGLVEEGVLRSHTLMPHNRRRDTIYYSLLQDEWNELRSKGLFEGKLSIRDNAVK